MYKRYSYVPATNALGLAGYRHERLSQADLMVFTTQYRPGEAEAATFTAVPISRDMYGRNHLSLGENLNTQYTRAMRTRPRSTTGSATLAAA